MLGLGVHNNAVGEEVGCLLGAAGFNNDVPLEVTIVGKGLECPDAGGDHAQTAAHEHIPVAHAALLHSIGLDIGNQNAVDQSLSSCQVLGGINGELGLVFVQQSAAILCNDLEEFIVGNGLPDTEDVITQSADLLSSNLQVSLSPVVGGVCNTGLIEQVLIVDQDNVGEALGQAVLLAANVECVQSGFVQSADINTGDFSQQALVSICCEVFDVQFVAVGCGATSDAGLHLGEVIIVADGFDFDLNVGMLSLKSSNHLCQGLFVAAGGVEVAVSNGYGLCGRHIFLIRRSLNLCIGLALSGVCFVVCGRSASCKYHQHCQNQGNQRKKLGFLHFCFLLNYFFN